MLLKSSRYATNEIRFWGSYDSYDVITDNSFAIIISKESFIMSTKFYKEDVKWKCNILTKY